MSLDDSALDARWLYLKRQRYIMTSAYAASLSAKAAGDPLGQIRLLRVASEASTAIAAVYGIGPGARADDDDHEDASATIDNCVEGLRRTKVARESGNE
jgi:hypothetical protein